jgi:transcription antitermination factor NusA-like protein
MEARVVVPDYQLSLAIGKEGQNARLAARLTGWRIDIRSDAAVAEPASGAAADTAVDAAVDPVAPEAASASPARSDAPSSEARSVPRQGREVARDAGVGTASDSAGTT